MYQKKPTAHLIHSDKNIFYKSVEIMLNLNLRTVQYKCIRLFFCVHSQSWRKVVRSKLDYIKYTAQIHLIGWILQNSIWSVEKFEIATMLRTTQRIACTVHL